MMKDGQWYAHSILKLNGKVNNMADLASIETKLDDVLKKMDALIKKMDEDEKIFKKLEQKG